MDTFFAVYGPALIPVALVVGAVLGGVFLLALTVSVECSARLPKVKR